MPAIFGDGIVSGQTSALIEAETGFAAAAWAAGRCPFGSFSTESGGSCDVGCSSNSYMRADIDFGREVPEATFGWNRTLARIQSSIHILAFNGLQESRHLGW